MQDGCCAVRRQCLAHWATLACQQLGCTACCDLLPQDAPLRGQKTADPHVYATLFLNLDLHCVFYWRRTHLFVRKASCRSACLRHAFSEPRLALIFNWCVLLAQDAPFFVEKLQIRMLPCVVRPCCRGSWPLLAAKALQL